MNDGRHTGEVLGADLESLYSLATNNLHSMADDFSSAAKEVGGAEDGLEDLFERSFYDEGRTGPVTSTMQTEVFYSWDTLRNTFQGILSTTAKNLEDVSDVLVMGVVELAENDSVAAESIKGILKEIDS